MHARSRAGARGAVGSMERTNSGYDWSSGQANPRARARRRRPSIASGAERLADDEPPAVDQATQRRGDVRVGRRERGLDRIGRNVAVDGEIAGTADESGCRLHHRERGRVVAVEAAEVLAVRDRLGPGEAERAGLFAEGRDALLTRLRHRAEHPDASAQHELRGRHPGHERQLRVPLLDRQRAPALE